MKFKKTLATLTTGLSLAMPVKAENFMNGVRGPTEWQFDTRIAVSERGNENGTTRIMSDTISLRYWNGGSKGIFSYVALPFKSIDNGAQKSEGLGDFSLGIGPRGSYTNKFGSLHYSSSFGLILPTGDDSKISKIGNGRTDARFSVGVTYLTPSKNNELDASLNYFRTEKGGSDDISFGVVTGRKLNEYFKLGGGIIGSAKNEGLQDGDYVLTARSILRYTHSKQWHTELWGDFDIFKKGIPDGVAGTLVFRYNF